MENTNSKDERQEYEEARKAYERLSPNKQKIFVSYLNMVNDILAMLLNTATMRTQ